MTENQISFQGWPKIARLNRDIVISEKIDGTNAAVVIVDRGQLPEGTDWEIEPIPGAIAALVHEGREYHVGAQSRNRLIFPGQDNAGFAVWVATHALDLVEMLGEGRHFGEWWGRGIQRGYDQATKRFSLFNTHRYADIKMQWADDLTILDVVPVLYQGPFGEFHIQSALNDLDLHGSKAAPGFMKPEGIIVFHGASGVPFKVTIEGDGAPKGLADRG